MVKTRLNIEVHVTPAEKFFLEKSLELLSDKTLDTYRLRINNPKTLLYELVSVIESVRNRSLRTHYIDSLVFEALDLFKKEKELKFKSVTKGFFLDSLSKKNYNNIYYASNLIISENRNYTQYLFELIKSEIIRINELATYSYTEFDTLNRYTQYFYIDLKKYGYNKQYLFNFIFAVFGGGNRLSTFQVGLDALQTLIERNLERFTIYFGFKFSGIGEELLKFDSFELRYIPRAEIEALANTVNNKFVNFLGEHPDHEFFYLEEEAIDYYKAGLLARKKLQKSLDMLFMATDDDIFNILPICFVLGTILPTRGNTQNLSYKLDGHFQPNILAYKRFIRRHNKIRSTSIVDPLTERKIYSTLRYLRLGTSASEQEHKLLNYWIAIEYLYSAVSAEEKKTERLNEYFKKMHSNTYVRRLFVDLHNSIKTFKIEASISKFDDKDLSYLLDAVTETEIENIKSRYPLLYYRFNTTKNRFVDSKNILTDLKRHSNNIEWNLIRIYRTRNAIVHSAAIDMEVIELAAHLKYFLIFTLNALFGFILASPIDLDNDKKISIDNFFLVESLRYDSLMANDKISVGELLTMSNPIEYLQK